MRIPRLTTSLLALAVAAGGLVAGAVVATAPPAAAASASGWNAGMIISDATFYNGGAMNAAQVQSFLAAQYQGCAAGYTCLRDLRVDTFDRAAAPGMCAAYAGAPTEPASVVIAKVAQACGVNPQALLVLLQKESGVVTSTTPNYRSATGYGCPDTAACDSRYYGFYNQVYMAAYQFKRYRLYPTQYGYVAGRSNYILYNPNSACGGTNVYIQNQATAGLYIYTPYQPNAAALANFYGTGDACSAYGNRNFYRTFVDWFGSPVGGATSNTLITAAGDPTVYLVSGGVRYAIADYATYAALPTSLGPIATVSSDVVAAFKAGPPLHRLVRDAAGSIYFFDAGIKLHVPDCGMVADYGGNCAKAFPQLDDGLLATFSTGPAMTSLFSTTSGKRFEVQAGTRREVMDDASLQQAGLSTATVVLTEGAIANLPYGKPVVRSGVVFGNRDTGGAADVDGGVLYTWSAATYRQTPLATAAPAAGQLDAASVALLGKPVALTGFARDPGSGTTSLLTSLGRSTFTPATFGVPLTTWPSNVLNAVAAAPPVGTATVFARSTSKPDVVAVTGGRGRGVTTWPALAALAGEPSPYVYTLSDDEFAAIPTGPQLLAPGTLVKGSTPDIWFVDGTTTKVHLSSFALAAQLGLTSYTTVPDTAIAAYTVGRGDVTPALACGSARYLGADGTLHPVSAAQATAYGLAFAPVAASTCYQLARTTGAPLSGPLFVRAVDDTRVYQLGDGTKRLVTTWAAFQRAASSSSVGLQLVPSGALDALPVGPAVS